MSQVLLAGGGAWPLACTLAILLGAYALRGATGFGSSVVAIPLLLLVQPVAVVIPLVTATSMLASIGQGLHQRRHVDWAAFRKLMLPALVGIAAGLWLFSAANQKLLLRAFALFIVGYALYGALPARRAARVPRWLAPSAGAIGGFVATVFGGMAGPFFVAYLHGLRLDKAGFRATVAVALVAVAAVRIAGYGGLGLYDERVLLLFGVSLPAVAVGMLAGEHLYSRMEPARFERVVAVLLALSGIALLFK